MLYWFERRIIKYKKIKTKTYNKHSIKRKFDLRVKRVKLTTLTQKLRNWKLIEKYA